MDHYSAHPRFYLAVDCIIFGFREDKLSLLLLKRNFEPAKGGCSLMGGFVQENESVDDAARRVLAELTGLTDIYMEQIGTFGEVRREPQERVVSVAYYALINIDDYNHDLARRHNAFWIGIDEIPELVFDHEEMVAKALEMLRNKAPRRPIGFNLLPKEFTLSKLQALYEAFYGMPLDKRNFRKQVAQMDCIEKVGTVDKTESKRGAALYRFNEKVFSRTGIFKL